MTALVALVAAAILLHISGGLQNLWTVAGSTAQSGNSVAAGGVNGGSAGVTVAGH